MNKNLDMLALVLLLLGGLNWGLIGLFNFDIVNLVLGGIPVLERILYVLVGLAALYKLKDLKK